MVMQIKTASTGVQRIAAAKINLYLHVTGRLTSGEQVGYHTLESLVAFAAIGDVISVQPAETVSLKIDGPMSPGLHEGQEDNLVIRAATALAEYANISAGAAITLKKHLPVASGIGGGSSDAAATLIALNALWELSVPSPELERLGLSLGADVPVCLRGRATMMTGVGERLAPIAALPDTHIVLVNPGVTLSTPAVFSALTLGSHEISALPSTFADVDELVEELKLRGNDLEYPALSLQPIIRDVTDVLMAGPDCMLARMSGSGATCFGMFADETAAVTCADQIMIDHPDWWVVATRLIDDTERLQELAA